MIKTIHFLYMLFIFLALGCSRDDSSNPSESSCGKISNVNFSTYPSSIYINFSSGNNANSYKIEYGVSGFSPGSGKSFVTSNPYADIPDLNHSTTYDIYITSICSATESSSPYLLSSVTTQQSKCLGTVDAQFYQFTANEIILDCSYSSGTTIQKYELEYGEAGFKPGTGTKQVTSLYGNRFTLNGLPLNKVYDFYVRAYCSDIDASSYKKFTYTTTPTCPKPFNLSSWVISGNCNSGSATRAFSWASYGSPTSYTIALITDINSGPGGQQFTTSEKSIAIGNMFCLWKGFYVKSNCGGESSEWAGPYIF